MVALPRADPGAPRLAGGSTCNDLPTQGRCDQSVYPWHINGLRAEPAFSKRAASSALGSRGQTSSPMHILSREPLSDPGRCHRDRAPTVDAIGPAWTPGPRGALRSARNVGRQGAATVLSTRHSRSCEPSTEHIHDRACIRRLVRSLDAGRAAVASGGCGLSRAPARRRLTGSVARWPSRLPEDGPRLRRRSYSAMLGSVRASPAGHGVLGSFARKCALRSTLTPTSSPAPWRHHREPQIAKFPSLSVRPSGH